MIKRVGKHEAHARLWHDVQFFVRDEIEIRRSAFAIVVQVKHERQET